MSDTPITDAEIEDARNVALEFNCKNPPPVEGENIYVVRIDFARQLERENNQLRAANDQYAHDFKQLRDELDCDGSDVPQLIAKIERINAELELARKCVEALRDLEYRVKFTLLDRFHNGKEVLLGVHKTLAAYDKFKASK